MSVNHSLKNLSKQQKLDLELAQTIVQNMNSVVQDDSIFEYDGAKFTPVAFGHESLFLNRILNLISTKSFDNSANYISEQVNSELNNINSKENNKIEYSKKMLLFIKNYPINNLTDTSVSKLIALENLLLNYSNRI